MRGLPAQRADTARGRRALSSGALMPPWVVLASALIVLTSGVVTVVTRSPSAGETVREIATGDALASLRVYDSLVAVRGAEATDYSPGSDGQRLRVRERVRTDQSGFGEITYFEGAVTRVDVNTEVEIARLATAPARHVRLSLDIGRTYNRLEKLSGDEETFEVATPVAVATVRGTVFVVVCLVRDTCTFISIDGHLRVTTISGRVVELPAGKQVTIGANGEVISLADADLAALFGDPWIARNRQLDGEATPTSSPTPTARPSPTPTPTPARTPTPRPTASASASPSPSPSPTPLRVTMFAFKSDLGSTFDIWVQNEDGSGRRRLTNDVFIDRHATLSPDGRRVAFVSDADGDDEVYVINTDGTGRRQLTSNAATDHNPSFSRDGSKIVFETDRDGVLEVYAMNADGSSQTRLTNAGANSAEPSFGPGNAIVFVSDRDGNHEIYTMNGDGTNVRRLTSNGANDRLPAFSPTGTTIAFTSDRDGNEEIYTMDPSGGSQTRRTNAAGQDTWSGWSPDGTRIQWTTDRNGDLEVYTMAADGTGAANWTNEPAHTDEDASWELAP